jgi:hypothetical protein
VASCRDDAVVSGGEPGTAHNSAISKPGDIALTRRTTPASQLSTDVAAPEGRRRPPAQPPGGSISPGCVRAACAAPFAGRGGVSACHLRRRRCRTRWPWAVSGRPYRSDGEEATSKPRGGAGDGRTLETETSHASAVAGSAVAKPVRPPTGRTADPRQMAAYLVRGAWTSAGRRRDARSVAAFPVRWLGALISAQGRSGGAPRVTARPGRVAGKG